MNSENTWTVDMRDVAIVLAYDYWAARRDADRYFKARENSASYHRACDWVDALAQAAGRMGLELHKVRPTEDEVKAASLRIRSALGPRTLTWGAP